MIKSDLPIYLASKSPRRKKLLKQIGLNFKTFSVELDEEIFKNESPIKAVKRLALEKLECSSVKVTDSIIITADTIVVVGKKIIGKPKNKKDAFKILKSLSGNTHNVYTGFAVYNQKKNIKIVNYEKTAVTFRDLTDKEIRDYIESGSPMDKAGAYGIQDDFGAVFITKINGCYYNVVGLPLSKLYSTIIKII